MARGYNCGAHKHTYIVPIEVHHIWPSGYHGPDIPENRIALCANAHSDVHYLLEAMLRGKKIDKRKFGPVVRVLAQKGYDDVVAYAEHLTTI